MRKLKATYKLEPGDGTGHSIADMRVRNARGICSFQGCGKKIKENAESRGMYGELCDEHDAEIETSIKRLIRQSDEHIIRVLESAATLGNVR